MNLRALPFLVALVLSFCGNSSALTLYMHQWAYQNAIDNFPPGTAKSLITAGAKGTTGDFLVPGQATTVKFVLPKAGAELYNAIQNLAFDDAGGNVSEFGKWRTAHISTLTASVGIYTCWSPDFGTLYSMNATGPFEFDNRSGFYRIEHNFPNITSPLMAQQSMFDMWVGEFKKSCGTADFLNYAAIKGLSDDVLKRIVADFIAYKFSKNPMTILEGWEVQEFPYAAGTVCTPQTCPGADTSTGDTTTTPGGGTSTTTPGASGPITVNVPAPNVTVNTPPPCRMSDGKTSGNPYDCAPKDADSNCSIIDLPCNLKRAFVPSPDFFSDSFREYTKKQLNLPVESTDAFTMNTGNAMFPVLRIDFGFMKNEAVQNVLRLIAWFQVAFWILNYIGFPNPFGGSRRGDSFAATALDSVLPPDSVGVDTGSKEHYDRLRADESWKS